MTKNGGMLIASALVAAVVVMACETGTDPVGEIVAVESSFEDGFDGWAERATEVMVGDDDEIDWEIERSVDRSFAGDVAVRMFADNRTDAARLWIERSVQLATSATYDVTIEFAFATADWSDVNLWTVLAGAVTERPDGAEELTPTHRDDTRAGDPPGEGFVWQERSYQTTVTTGVDGEVWIVIGVWGTSEFQRTYYLDDVRVRLTPTSD